MKRENLIILLIIALVVIYFVSNQKEKFATTSTYYLKTNESFTGNPEIKTTLPKYYYISIVKTGNNYLIKLTDDKTKATKFTDNNVYDIKVVSTDTNINGKHVFIRPGTQSFTTKFNSNYGWTTGDFRHLAFELAPTLGALKTGTQTSSTFLYLSGNSSSVPVLNKKHYSTTNNPKNPIYSTFVKETA